MSRASCETETTGLIIVKGNKTDFGASTTTDSGSSEGLFVRDRLTLAITVFLLSVAGISWAASYYLMPLMMTNSSGMMMSTGVASIVPSSTPISISVVALFEIIWIVGMTAMMFPALIPIVLFYYKISTKLETHPRLARAIGTPLFLSAYLFTYAVLGIAAWFGAYLVLNLSASLSPGLLSTLGILVPAAILIATGVYQFTPQKNACLKGCVSPMGFFALKSQKGLVGSLRMGFRHGTYCVGCCFAYMIVMLVVGAMSIPVMAVMAAVIALEKVIVKGSKLFGGIVGAGFIAGGILVLIFPSLLSYV